MLSRAYPLLVLGTMLPWSGLAGQTVEELAARLVGMTAVSGYEQAMADSLQRLLPGAERDRAGNVVGVLGSGEPVRLAVCPMDEWGYVVGRIQDDGYVTVRRVGGGAPTFFDQGHEGHRMTVWGRTPVPAVTAVPSTHLLRGRERPTAVFTADDIVLDLGAGSAAEVEALGVSLVNPVALAKTPHRYGPRRLAGPEAGQRSSCAALVAAYRMRPVVDGTLVVAFTVESRIRHRGLQTVVNAYGPFRGTALVDYRIAEGTLRRIAGETLGTVEPLAVPTRYDGSPVETVDLDDVVTLRRMLLGWIQGELR